MHQALRNALFSGQLRPLNTALALFAALASGWGPRLKVCSDSDRGVIGMVTGSQSGTYIKVGQDIANVVKTTAWKWMKDSKAEEHPSHGQ